MSTDSVVWHEHNPDPMFDGCRNSGIAEPGVVFQNVEPMEGVFTFIGRSALLEAFAVSVGLSPNTVMDYIEGSNAKSLRAQIHKLEDEKSLLAERLATINSIMLEDVKNEAAANDAGDATGPEVEIR